MPAEGALPADEPGPLQLIETLRWSSAAGFVRLDRHLRRLAASAEAFGIAFDEADAIQLLRRSVAGDCPLKVRLVLHFHGRMKCEAAALKIEQAWHFTFSPHWVQSGDPLLRYKTNRRDLFNRELARAGALGLQEVLFLNERGEVTQGSRSNLFARVGSRLVTPARQCGLLNGCLRAELVESGACAEAILFPEELFAASELYFGNSLRGLMAAIFIPPPSF
jgi:branched-subunit amino acid aminotransferase/4-amino-4-deoxychorismate lyase